MLSRDAGIQTSFVVSWAVGVEGRIDVGRSLGGVAAPRSPHFHSVVAA